MNKDLVRSTSLVIGGMLIGSSVTYLVVKNRMEQKYRNLAEEEIASVKETYDMIKKRSSYSTPERAAEALANKAKDEEPVEQEEVRESVNQYSKLVNGLGYNEEEPVKTTNDPRPPAHSIFDNDEEVDPSTEDVTKWDRSGNTFVISFDEFMAEDAVFERSTLSWFEDDDTLMEDSDQSIITDIEGTVGRENLEHFGKGSQDKDVVFVRNMKSQMDFEITKEEGSYTKVVLGIEDWDTRDIQEPAPKVLKMRNSD